MKKTVFIILVILTAIQTDGFSQKKRERERMKADALSATSQQQQVITKHGAW
jgi:hypothetical protein